MDSDQLTKTSLETTETRPDNLKLSELTQEQHMTMPSDPYNRLVAKNNIVVVKENEKLNEEEPDKDTMILLNIPSKQISDQFSVFTIFLVILIIGLILIIFYLYSPFFMKQTIVV